MPWVNVELVDGALAKYVGSTRGGILLHNQEEMNLTKLHSCVQVEDKEDNIFCRQILLFCNW